MIAMHLVERFRRRHRTHGYPDHDRRSEGVHEAADLYSKLAAASGFGTDRVHLQRELSETAREHRWKIGSRGEHGAAGCWPAPWRSALPSPTARSSPARPRRDGPECWTSIQAFSTPFGRRPTVSRSCIRRSLRADDRCSATLEPAICVPVLEALGVPEESQLLVFSKTGVQRAYTSPHNPRAIFFDESVVVAYVPGAPIDRARGPRSPARSGVLHARSSGRCACPHSPDQLSHLSCVGEHAQRARHHRAQQHRG